MSSQEFTYVFVYCFRGIHLYPMISSIDISVETSKRNVRGVEGQVQSLELSASKKPVRAYRHHHHHHHQSQQQGGKRSLMSVKPFKVSQDCRVTILCLKKIPPRTSRCGTLFWRVTAEVVTKTQSHQLK